MPRTRGHPSIAGRHSVALDAVPGYDAVLIVTAHDAVDHAAVAAAARRVVDTRNAPGRAGFVADHVVKA